MDAITLGHKIRLARELARLSQRALAAKTGIAQSKLSRCETGQHDVRVLELYAIAAACDTTVQDILEAVV